ncbi:MAG: 50S ribosomal protein L10, partial [Oscillospiraceae bacterium]
MPTQKVLEQKKQIVAQLKDTLTSSAAGVIVDYKGISVAQDTILRKTFREAGVEYKVVKNTLLKLAAQEAGFEWDDILEGTTAIAVAKDDVISPAKIA